jgi:hypothetical protein
MNRTLSLTLQKKLRIRRGQRRTAVQIWQRNLTRVRACDILRYLPVGSTTAHYSAVCGCEVMSTFWCVTPTGLRTQQIEQKNGNNSCFKNRPLKSPCFTVTKVIGIFLTKFTARFKQNVLFNGCNSHFARCYKHCRYQ